MKIDVRITLGLASCALLFGVYQPVIAQSELLTKGQSGVGAWGGLFTAGGTSFGSYSFGISIEDMLDINVSQTNVEGRRDGTQFTFAVHKPSATRNEIAGGGVILSIGELTGIGVGWYNRFKVSRRFLLVPAATGLYFPNLPDNASGNTKDAFLTIGAHFAILLSDDVMFTLTPQYGTWFQETTGPESYGVSAGLLLYGGDS